MSQIDRKYSDHFRQWEVRTRGWQLWDEPVHPEPAFVPFFRNGADDDSPLDDGRRPTVVSTWVRGLGNRLAGKATESTPRAVIDFPDPEPRLLSRDSLVEFQIPVPRDIGLDRNQYGLFFSSLTLCREPMSFELVFGPEKIVVLLGTSPGDAPLIEGQLSVFFPELGLIRREDVLLGAWTNAGPHYALVDCGLARECMYCLETGKADPYLPLFGALSQLRHDELAVFQVLFEPVRHPWAESILSAVTDGFGRDFFANVPNLAQSAKEKIARPLYAATLRLATKADSAESAMAILERMASALSLYGGQTGNALMPLPGNPSIDFETDLMRRETHRSGMIVNGDELASLAHIPSGDIESAKLRGNERMSKAAPAMVCGMSGLSLGTNHHHDIERAVTLPTEARVRHMHVIGASGTGKSTLLFNSIKQDIEAGHGIGLLDPHGDLADMVLSIIPPSRVDDVVYLDPSDGDFPVGFNILHAHSDLEKTLLASDLVSVFERLSQAWGDQMGSVLRNAILAFLESSRGGSLIELRRFLLEPAFRESFLKTVSDPEILYYWHKGFPTLSGNKSIGPVLTRLETFLAPKSIRYMVGQTKNRIDFGDILDRKKIFIAKLSQGTIGKENSYLLGTLIVSKLQELAMSRQAVRASERVPFFLYIDEFHNFITPSMAEILSGARKYGLGLVLSHQELRQLERDREVASAVLSNCHTRVVFRVGDSDARTLADGFASFGAKDIQSLGTGEAICRVERSDFDFNLSVPFEPVLDNDSARTWREFVIAASRKRFGTPREEVERELVARQSIPEEKTEEKAVRTKRIIPQEETVKTVVPPLESKVVDRVPVADVVVPHIEQVTPILEAAVTPSQESESKETGTPGRGGPLHKHIQSLIKQWAEGMGYRATIEKNVLHGTGSVDVALEKGERRIACEVSITTPPEQEISNIKKCVEAGFRPVCLICTESDRVTKMKKAVSKGLLKDELDAAWFGTPDEFFALVQDIEARALSCEKVVKGYKVKVSYRPLDARERSEAEQGISQAVVKRIERTKRQ